MRMRVGALILVVLSAACGSGSTGGSTSSSSSGDVVDAGGGTSSSSSGGNTSDAGPRPENPTSQQELESVTTTLASDDMNGRNEGTEGAGAARAYIVNYMMRCSLQPAGTEGYEQLVETGVGINLLGRIEGTDAQLRDRTIILSAHYDHLGSCSGDICNGANDNAAGVATILAIGCELAANPPRRSVLIAAWDAEEPPTFLSAEMGSEFYAAHPTIPLEQTDVAIVLDLVGGELWPGYDGHFVLGAESSAEVKQAVTSVTAPAGIAVYRTGLHMVERTRTGLQPWSDYDPFRDRDIPVLFLSNGQNKLYHTPDDEVETLNFVKVAAQTQYLLDIVQYLGDSETTPTFVDNGSDYAGDVENIQLVLQDALAAGGLVDSLNLSSTSESTLQADLTEVNDIKSRMDGGATPSASDVSALRRATQHIMCLAGSTYSEATCSLF
ncbi:MAG: M28 family peptidase [Myxococcota bacterium]